MSITLFDEKKDCCGCGACVNACMADAISMVEDECGFRYPQIDAGRCVSCGMCVKVCGYQDIPTRKEALACYAAAAKNQTLLKKSTSGGVFAVLAETVLKQSGIVYGAAMPREGSLFQPKHIRIDDVQMLSLLQGSKYVQSDIGLMYRDARQDLLAGKNVLFSGTPCQIAGLKKYLRKEYDNLMTAEVICHGVPSAKMFRDFIAVQEGKYQQAICEFSFRSKVVGQGETVCMQLADERGDVSKIYMNGHFVSYVHYFLKSYLCRINCYSCPFATKARVADLTLGDYWGFHEEYPQIKSGHALNDGTGVSCVLVNSERGLKLLRACEDVLTTMETQYEKIARHNMQLNRPCKFDPEREVIMKQYREKGYKAVEEHYQHTCKNDRLKQRLVSALPKKIKRVIKRMIGKLKQN